MNKILSIILIIFIVSIPVYAEELEFSETELAFIENHPVIRIGVDPNFVPFEFIDIDGEYKGIANDFLILIEEKTGIEFVLVENLTWDQAYEYAVERKLDVLPSVSQTNERERYFLFSSGYYDFQRIIMMNEGNTEVQKLEDLYDKTVAVQENSSHHSYLKDYPNINLSLYSTVEEALNALANGSESYFVGNLATTNYMMKQHGITQMKYVELKSKNNVELHIAVRNDWPELQSIINKCLNSITEEERIEIYNKWIDVKYGKDYTGLIRVLLIVASVVIISVFVSLFWVYKLKKEIQKRIEIENDLKVAKKEAETANEVKSNFLARMSHEIRTPLNGITGLTYLVLNSDLTHSQRAHMEKLKNASDTMLSIINDILDFSKIESGKVILENEPFELDEVIRNTLNIIGFKVEEKKLHLTLTKDPKLPNFYYGDRIRIGQILLNLLNNAIKFTSEGDITMAINLFGFEKDEYQVEFVIQDTGIGMSESHLSNLFQPFVQEDATITRRFGGTGLGLSITKNLVELMGGHIDVNSQLEKGTKFSVRIKLKVDEKKEYEVKKGFEYIHDIKTLVLNKNMDSLSLIMSYLKSFSIDAEFTSSEVQFKSLLNSGSYKSYDLLIIYENTLKSDLDSFLSEVSLDSKTKIILIKPYGHSHKQEPSNVFTIHEPFLPSMLYNGIAKLFKFKVMASQVENSSDYRVSGESYSGHILVVEDNLTNQMIAKELLEPYGFTIDQAYNGQEGLEKTRIKDYNLILMDLHMPLMNGYELTKAIRQTSQVPIIAMTADAIEGVKEKCHAYGMTDFISKPFVPEKFIRRVISYFNSESTDEVREQIIDYELGLKLLSGNEELYDQIKQVFIEENQALIENLNQLILDHSYDEAKELVHKVKSSAGSLGAEQVRITANVLQDALENQDDSLIVNIYDKFKMQFQILMQELKG